MDLSKYLSDDRLLAHLIGIHVVLAAIAICSIVLRKLLKTGGEQVARWTGFQWLDGISKEAVKSVRPLLFWTTIALMAVSVGSMVFYHVSGRDARHDLHEWYSEITHVHLIAMGTLLGKLVLLAIGVSLAFRFVRRVRVFLEVYVHHHLPKHVHPDSSPQAGANVLPFSSAQTPDVDRRLNLEATIRNSFTLLERYAVAVILIYGLSVAGNIVGLLAAHSLAHLAYELVTYFMAARLLSLACRTLFHVFANFGNRFFDQGHLHRYWERIVRLFPFGEKCFEAAIWIYAASQCFHSLKFIEFIAAYGDHVVECIAIFFGTRVLIELLHVFINEAFGMFDEERAEVSKGATLVPLLESVSRYAIYFGSVLMMLRVFGVDTTPILASAGVIGLAVGLGAQSFVSDVVSGFFILFEEQYFVGDIVQIGDAQGRVEAINIRHTQIRDENGKLYIIPNGQIKMVVNFSKGYVNAVVDVKVPTSTNLDQVMRDMAEAGKRLRISRREVMADTVIKGLVDLTPSDMTIRAVTKVQPGLHVALQQEYRKILKEVFDESARTMSKAVAA
jgi:moderate conductance mechanosensitive channel